jgi:hypothetical protein
VVAAGTFSSPIGPLKMRQLYFIHFENRDRNEVDNYIDVDVLNHSLGTAYGSQFVPLSLLKCFRRPDTGDLNTHPYRVNNTIDIGFDNGKHLSQPLHESVASGLKPLECEGHLEPTEQTAHHP